AVAVVEEVLGQRVVHRDDGVLQHALIGHGAQADHAGGGFLGAADDFDSGIFPAGVQRVDQVGAVVHGDLGLAVEGGVDVRVIGRVVLTLDGVDGNAAVAHQRSGHVVLGGEGV